MSKEIKGFSKLTKKEKIEWLSKSCFKDSDSAKKILTQYWNIDSNLQKLHDEFSNSGLVVLAIPSQDFFQEFNDNNKVKNFCDTNFSLTLPMTTITSVKGKDAHPFFKWLANEHNFRPVWNFNKVLLDKQGMFVASFGSFTNPNSRKIKSKIINLLKN